MKTQELRKVLQGVIEIIDLYPNQDISLIIKDIIKLKKSVDGNAKKIKSIEKAKAASNSDAEKKKIIDQLYNEIDSLSISEIEEKLESTEIFPSMAYIRYFSSKLDLELTSRQSRANSIHTIKNHFDRTRIDKTISKRNE